MGAHAHFVEPAPGILRLAARGLDGVTCLPVIPVIPTGPSVLNGDLASEVGIHDCRIHWLEHWLDDVFGTTWFEFAGRGGRDVAKPEEVARLMGDPIGNFDRGILLVHEDDGLSAFAARVEAIRAREVEVVVEERKPRRVHRAFRQIHDVVLSPARLTAEI